MATSNQLLTLVKSFYDGDEENVKTIVLQIAAHEAKIGHSNLAKELKNLVSKQGASMSLNKTRQVENSLLIKSYIKNRISDLIVSSKLEEQIDNIILEFAQRSKLNKNGYYNRRKILLEGPPGTGKTMTASVLATELKLPLYRIQTDKLISKYMGETGVKLRQIFDAISQETAVYFFDEFDSIGSERGADNDVKEMHRVLNLFLQFIEQDFSDSIIIAATNSGASLDQALFRRFDDVLRFQIPSEDEIVKLIKLKLNRFRPKNILLNDIVKAASGLCHADITKACENAIKQAILNDQSAVDSKVLYDMMMERKMFYKF